MSVTCSWFPACGGCDHWDLSPTAQHEGHVRRVQALLEAQGLEARGIPLHAPAPFGLRDRLDFILRDGRFGLYGRASRDVIDLPDCLQLSPALADFLKDFRRRLPPVPLASVRLRVSPTGARGLWLDLPNLDIKRLLDEASWLLDWDPSVTIEMGQRRKHVSRAEGRPRFEDPVLRPWSRTSWRDREVDLFGVVGGFTQPGHRSNRFITDWFRQRASSARRIVEFGSGNGNLSFPALSGEATLVACETDALSLAGFRESLSRLAAAGIDLRERVRLEEGDFHRRSTSAFGDADLLIANPARSGLKGFLDGLAHAPSLERILYMSCHPESFAADARRLATSGFHLNSLELLDQFPQTKHIEVLSDWRRH